MSFAVEFLRVYALFRETLNSTQKSLRPQQVGLLCARDGEVMLTQLRDESSDSGWCTERALPCMPPFLCAVLYGIADFVLGVSMKVVTVAVAVGLGASMICAGCGSGYSVLAMSSPSISQVSPQVIQVGTPSATVTVKGSNFDSKSAIVFNGAAVPTTIVSSDTLAAQVGSSALAQPSVAQVLVRNSAGIASNSMPVTISSAQSKPANPALAITTTSLAAAGVGAPYSVTLGAMGGTPTYKWTVTGGSLPAGLGLSSAGVLSGTASTAGTSTFAVQVQDSSTPVQSQSVSLTLVVAPAAATANPLSVNSVVFASGQVGTAYSATLSASGGTPSYTWAITSGSLPAGLALSPGGTISGTPTTSQVSSFTVTASDSSSPVQTKSMSGSISISPNNLTITTTGLASGKNGALYSAQLVASGGTPGYSWSVSSGSLPAGLTLSSAGVISGTPNTNGTQKFTVTVADSGSPAQQQSASFSIHVSGSGLSIGSTALSAGQVGLAYSAAFSVSGGTPAYTWSIASGSLPAGLTLSSAGVLSGKPAASGTSTFTVQVADSSSPIQTTSAAVTLSVQASALLVTSTTLGSAKTGSAYSASMSASGGTPGYTWSIASGSLPAGLSMSSAGLISGTPTASGTSSFTVQVADSGSPNQTATASVSIAVQSSTLSITSTSLASGKTGTAYSAPMSASGGTPAYTWLIASGSLPAGLSLSTTGVISGTPTASGSSSFTVAVKDSGSPSQSVTATESITVASSISPLTISSSTLASGQVGVAYSGSLSATGGTQAYSWSIASGSLPAGLSLAAATGVISGTPTTSGTANFTVQVADSSSPVQTQSMTISLPIAAAAASTGAGTTWYVRPDGGTRYSVNMTSGQCDGQADVAYPGTGVNQHCAFKDVRYLWQDGSYTTGGSFPGWGWVGKGGDTYLIRGSIGTGVSYRIGWNNKTSSYDGPTSQYWGLQGDPYGSGAPAPPSGTATQHTRILGENYAACHAASAKTQLHGGYGVGTVLNMAAVSYVDVACLDITDFSSCGRAGQTNGCNTNLGSLDDYANTGIYWSNTATHDSLTDIHIHGMAENGMGGPTGDGMVFDYLDILGNASSGWNADPNNGTTGTGSLLVTHYNISWNGCAEEYPAVDSIPYNDCTDDNSSGYGDGFGTATLSSSPGWNVTFDQGTVSYNTQDGLDALHIAGSGSTMTVKRTLAYSNMGQQIKVGGAFGTAINNIIYTNCNAMRQAIPGTPSGYNSKLSDFCRAADGGIKLTVDDSAPLVFQFNTIYSANATAIDIECNETCSANTKIDFRNNIFVGFLNNAADGYPSGGTGDYSNPVYNGTSVSFFTNAGSIYSNNITFHPKSNWVCPAAGETNAICGDPKLTDETWHLYGYSNVAPISGLSPGIGSGTSVSGITLDYNGVSRPTPPSIGALEP